MKKDKTTPPNRREFLKLGLQGLCLLPFAGLFLFRKKALGQSGGNSTESFTINLNQFNQGRTNFTSNYTLSGGNTSFGGQDIAINWGDLSGIVNNFATTNSISPSSLALRFVHCYDSVGGNLYSRMQICSLQSTSTTKDGRPVYNLVTSPTAWYQINSSGIASTSVTTLSDSNYLNAFYYHGGTGSPQQLSSDGGSTFVRSLTFPWTELSQMYANNGQPSGAKVHFAACSYSPLFSDDANVNWPHHLVIYLSVAGTSLLNNTVNQSAIFQNKAADMGTLCPPQCGIEIDSSAY